MLPNVTPISTANEEDLSDLIQRIVKEEIEKVLLRIATCINDGTKRTGESSWRPRPRPRQENRPTQQDTGRKTDLLHTSDNVPICFHCGRPDHLDDPFRSCIRDTYPGGDLNDCNKSSNLFGTSEQFHSTARGGRVRSTTPAEDRYIVLSAKRNRRTTAQQVANQFLASSRKQISRKPVSRRLRGGGLYARRPVVCVPLTRQHRTARLQWCREHHNWTDQDWACVLFSDESRFSLSSDCRRQLIWRESGTAYRPENIQEKDRYPTCSIMVWASIMINGRTRLHVVANGTMTGQRYIDEVLLPHVRLFHVAVGDKFVFMDDNATCHRTLAVQDCLDNEGIQRLVWSARSPDLNTIENVWDALGRQVAGRNYPPTNKNTLIRALTEEWDKSPQQLLDNVVQSMVRRVECCITLHGGDIPY
ncbi:transposable element Tc1 transposase [Trichonephila clavipes]|nr:transposable element Tc1 transposase [Trichonephila clavipes]